MSQGRVGARNAPVLRSDDLAEWADFDWGSEGRDLTAGWDLTALVAELPALRFQRWSRLEPSGSRPGPAGAAAAPGGRLQLEPATAERAKALLLDHDAEDLSKFTRLAPERQRLEAAFARSAAEGAAVEIDIHSGFNAPPHRGEDAGDGDQRLRIVALPALVEGSGQGQGGASVVWRGLALRLSEPSDPAAARVGQAGSLLDPATRTLTPAGFLARTQSALTAACLKRRRVAVIAVGMRRFERLLAQSFGIEGGQTVLATLADRLRPLVPEGGALGRLQGNSFGILMHDVEGLGSALGLVARLLEDFEAPLLLGDQRLHLQASCGVSISDDRLDSADALTSAAFRALDDARRSERAYCLHSEVAPRTLNRRLELETALRHALAQESMHMVFQPIVDAGDGRTVAAEALMRWHRSDGEIVSPAEFIPLAQEAGLMRSLGMIALEQSCALVAQLRAQGLEPPPIAVNLAGEQLDDPWLDREIMAVMDAHGVPPALLQLELTEQSLMRDVEGSLRLLTRLTEQGLKIAVDDFGSGYSSLSYLATLPVSKVKLDRCLVNDLPSDRRQAAVVRAVVAIAEALELEVVAEGVERAAQGECLRALGCTQFQGFYFARPGSAEALTARLRDEQIRAEG